MLHLGDLITNTVNFLILTLVLMHCFGSSMPILWEKNQPVYGMRVQSAAHASELARVANLVQSLVQFLLLCDQVLFLLAQ
jgi:large-conductance mechanosensitive channel